MMILYTNDIPLTSAISMMTGEGLLGEETDGLKPDQCLGRMSLYRPGCESECGGAAVMVA